MKRVSDQEATPFLRFLRRYIWIIAFVLGVVTVTVMRPFTRRIPPPPEVMYTLPEFSLVDQDGRVFDHSKMAGKVWIAGFIFTSCPSTCPKVSRAMMDLQKRFQQQDITVNFVSFTVDPEVDTPKVLKNYADNLDVDQAHWRFVTGNLDDVTQIVVDGFKLAVGDKPSSNIGVYDIAHSTKLALVDPEGGVRGFYSIEGEGPDELFHRTQHVMRAYR